VASEAVVRRERVRERVGREGREGGRGCRAESGCGGGAGLGRLWDHVHLDRKGDGLAGLVLLGQVLHLANQPRIAARLQRHLRPGLRHRDVDQLLKRRQLEPLHPELGDECLLRHLALPEPVHLGRLAELAENLRVDRL